MAELSINEYPVIIVTFIIGITVIVLMYIKKLLVSANEKKSAAKSPVEQKPVKQPTNVPKPSKKKPQSEKWSRKVKSFSHPWLVASLKGHSGKILDIDMSNNGNFLITCAEDRSVLVWNAKNWPTVDHKSVRINIPLDHIYLINWGPDCRNFYAVKSSDNVIELYKATKKSNGMISSATPFKKFPKNHEEDIISMSVACHGKFFISCSSKTDLIVWDFSGKILATVDTYLMFTHQAKISPCGRFIAASGFTSDVKIWEVVFKQKDFQRVQRAFDLSGHSAGIHDFSFSEDSSRIATISKDGTWKVFNTNIEYNKGESPHLLVTAKYNQTGKTHIAMSPNGEVVVVASGRNLQFFSALNGECDSEIESLFTDDIQCIQFDSLGKFLLAAGERHVHVFHNVTGYKVHITSIQSKFHHKISSAQKERMEMQIRDAKNFLKNFN